MADNTILPIPSTTGDTIAADEIAGIKFQRIKVTLGADGVNDGDVSSANPLPVSTGLVQGLTDTQLRASAIPVSGTISVTGVSTETTLSAINTKLPTAIVALPAYDTPSLPIRVSPQKYFDCSFSSVGSGLLTTDFTQIRAGSGMTISQSAGNLVVATGTTVNAEFVARSISTFSGALTLREITTLSQRIANNNFYIELVDVIGDLLPYNIVSTTSVDVTKTAHGYTAANIGQRMDLCALSSVGVPMEGVILSIPDANTIRFTVAGYPASGSGTLSLTGYNKIEFLYTATTATQASFNTRRRGWQNTAFIATINTTASPHMAIINSDNGITSVSDKPLTAGFAMNNRTAFDTNIPEPSVNMYVQIRAKNGTTAPATTTTWTIGMIRVEDYIPTQVSLVSTRQQSLNTSLPVTLISGSTTAVTGTVTSNIGTGTLAAVTSANLGIPTPVADVVSAALTTTTTTAAFTPTFGTTYIIDIPVTAVSGTTPTLDIGVEESTDSGTNWYRVYDFPRITATGSYRSPPLTLRGNRVRYVQTVTGTTPSFTRAISRLQRSDDAPLRANFIDRTIVPNTLNSVTPTYYVEGLKDFNFMVRCTAQTAAATFTAQFSNDGTNWHTTTNTLATIVGIVHVKVQNEQWKFGRLIVSAAGTGVVLAEAMIVGAGS